MKKIRYFLEAVLIYLIFGLFKCLPAKAASDTGGWIGRHIGPLLPANDKAIRHILMAMPELEEPRAREIARGMWENLGRVVAEYPHLEEISRYNTVFENEQRLLSLLEKEDQPIIFIGGHISNWEINPIALLTHHNRSVDVTYRAPNNPWVVRLLDYARTLNRRVNAYPKSAASGRKMMQAMKEGHALGILIDQKYNEGIEVPFFGLPAMTNPIAVLLCQRYRCPLVPVKNIRSKDDRSFRIITYPPLGLFEQDGAPRPPEDVLKEAHALLEAWIREHPEQWLWLHNRWKTD